MTCFQWRRFNFFDLVSDIDSGSLEQSFKDVNIVACSSGRGFVVLGDNAGFIHLLDRQHQCQSFKAYSINISHVIQLKQSSFLSTVGEDEPGINPVIKIWSLDKKDMHGNPVCVHLVRALPGNRPVPVTAFAIDEEMHLMAAGFADGSIMVYQGDLTRERHSKQKYLQPGTSSITGLSLRTHQKVSHLFASTSSTVFSYIIRQKDKEQLVPLDSVGCATGCFVLADSKQSQHFMIARNDAVYCYTTEGRGPCYAFEGEKLALQWFRGYLIIASKMNTKGDASSDKVTITIFDVHNKFIAFTGAIVDVHYIVSEWGSLLVVTKDKKMHQFIEKDLHSKLDILFKKNLYDVAIRVAKSQQYDVDGLVEIFRHYGDHLYAKGNHSGAMEQYLKTIGRLEPSYVIKRFLDAQRIHQLTAYLQELHKQSRASEDHTTLLLNCYTKLRDTERLNEFLSAKDQQSEFDVETAIRVCRQAGYFEQALRLAQDRQNHDWYLKILLEDTCDYQTALDYMRQLPTEQAKNSLQQYGSVLLEQLPDETTRMLLELCTKNKPEVCNPSEFLLLFMNQNTKLLEFLEQIIQSHPASDSSLYFTLLEQYLIGWSKKIHDVQLEKKIIQLVQHSSVLASADRALFVCQTHKFRPGVLLIFEKTKLYSEILNFYASEDDFDNIIMTCRRFGQQEPNLWVKALTAATCSDKATQSCLAEILSAIEKMKLLPPLRVIEILCRSPTATLGLARDYLIRTLQTDQTSICEDERLIQQYRQETTAVREKIHDIKTSALVFQGSKCSVCNQPLELPSIHFLCLHSFHQHCFDSYADNENECPACHTDNKRILDIVRAQEQSKDLHEAFHGQLEKAQDPFTVLADYFGRGVFNTLPTWEAAVSTSVARKDLSLMSMWGPVNAGPGSEAQIRRNEGKVSSTHPTSLAVNEGRMRVQEVGSRATSGQVSEGQLRAMEAHAAAEKRAASFSTTSEARQRLQEGSKPTAAAATSSAVKIPVRTASATNVASSVPTKKSAASIEVSNSVSSTSNVPSNRHVRNSSGTIMKSAIPVSNQNANTETSNPFGSDEDEDYDQTKNPFADDEVSANPFGTDDDYNDALNPFAE